jgi:hypothetical protein
MLVDCAQPSPIAMTSIPRHELLRPSLDGSSPIAAAPYSQQTGMWSAFFGGPLAAVAMIGINARRVGRTRSDMVWVIALAVAYVAWTYFLHATPAGEQARSTLVGWLGPRGPAYLDRFIALMVFLLGMLLHRSEQRSSDLFDLKRPNGWVMGIGLIVAGIVASSLLILGVGG